MATNGKLEARITIPSGGWVITLDDSTTAATAIVLPAGTYYHSSDGSNSNTLAEALTTAANLLMNQTWGFSVVTGEGDTGKYTIQATGGGGPSVTFTNTDLRDLMGFTGDLTGASSYLSPSQAKGLFLASSGFQKKNGKSGGSARVSDQQHALNSSGYVFAVQGRDYKTAEILWPMETRAKCWTLDESTANESFETFLYDGIWGKAAWGTVVGPIRFHPDADDDADYGTFSAIGLGSWDPTELVPHFSAGRWAISLPMLIEVPT